MKTKLFFLLSVQLQELGSVVWSNLSTAFEDGNPPTRHSSSQKKGVMLRLISICAYLMFSTVISVHGAPDHDFVEFVVPTYIL